VKRALLLLVVALALTACSNGGGGADADAQEVGEQVSEGTTTTATSPEGDLTLRTVSTRAEFVTGGDVLVEVSGSTERPPEYTVTVDGEDRTDAFAAGDDGESPALGLIDGLPDGDSVIEATSGGQTARLTVTNHPISGPVFAGPHLEPWVCHTEEAGLGPSSDDDCTVEPRTTVEDGVRIERGVIDRGIYTLTMPDDPADWNHRLVYRFGGGCGTSFGQGSDLGSGGVDRELLHRGYAVATNTLDTLQTICNTAVSAEAALMTREHFAETYGVPEFTIGDGASGGAIQQLVIAQNQPGLLDALSPAAPFPDVLSTAAGVSDCGLFERWFDTPEGRRLSDAQRAAVVGHLTAATCTAWNTSFVGGVRPSDGCDPALPAEQIYDAEDNPEGARCDLQDSNVGVLGVDPDTGFARRPLSNEGVQYGLEAFADGIIDFDQFVALNEGIGGFDIDGNVVAERETMSDEVAALAYTSGGITGPGPLQDVPIILRSPFTDPLGDIHTRYYAMAVRHRLARGGEDDPNLVLWTTAATGEDVVQALTGSLGGNEAIYLLDDWLTSGRRPAEATNRCLLPNGDLLTGGWELYDEPGPCRDAFPVSGDPRAAAGGPDTGDVIACRLGSIEHVDEALHLSDQQQERLAEVFPDGVCDWTMPGRGQQPPVTTWPTYPGS